MAQKSVLKFSAIVSYFVDEKKAIERGENAYESGHVNNMQFNDELNVISGSVHASMKDKLYKVEILLDEYGSISGSSCTCPRGQAICHHVAALAMFAHRNISITDKSCVWSVKRPSKADDVKMVADLYPPSKSFVACKTEITEDDMSKVHGDLARIGGNMGFKWLLDPEVVVTETPIVVTISEVILATEYWSSPDKIAYFKQKMQVSYEKAVEIASITVGQASNPLWLRLKKFRVTASNFAVILGACRRNRYPPSLFKRLTGTYNLDGVRAIQWGRENEKRAGEALSAATGLPIISTGLWLDECGFIGASPDGLVGDDGILEIKCPYKYRNTDLLLELESDQSYIIYYEKENKVFKVNTNHEYYHQIQGQLHILKRKLCYLVVWTPKVVAIEIVHKQDIWSENLDILKTFYLDIFLNDITNRELDLIK